MRKHSVLPILTSWARRRDGWRLDAPGTVGITRISPAKYAPFANPNLTSPAHVCAA